MTQEQFPSTSPEQLLTPESMRLQIVKIGEAVLQIRQAETAEAEL